MKHKSYRPSHLPLPPPQIVRVLNVLDVSKDLGVMRLTHFPVEIS